MENTIIAKLYCEKELLIDVHMDHLHEYVFALKNSDSISVNGIDYKLKKIKLIHDTGKKIVILHIDLRKISEP